MTPTPEGKKKKKEKRSVEDSGDAKPAPSKASSEIKPLEKKKRLMLQDEGKSEASSEVTMKEVEGVNDHDREGSKATTSKDTGIPVSPSSPYPLPAPRTGNVSILLFYAYCIPPMTKSKFDKAMVARFCLGITFDGHNS
jgi:hypothetical protein